MQLHVATPETGPRTEHDLVLLLAELDRALAAYAQTQAGAGRRVDLARRTALLFELELERGSIEIQRSGQHFAAADLGDLPCRYLTHLVRAMELHRVDRMAFAPGMRPDDFARLVELLSIPNAHLDDLNEGGFPGRLYESTRPGIDLNGIARPRRAEPPEPIAQPEIGGGHRPIGASTRATPPTSSPPAWPALEEDPFEAPAMVMKGEQLRLSLRELDRCDDDLLYDALVDRVIDAARELWKQQHPEEAYRALLVLTAHASDTTERPNSHVLMAQSALQRFADEEVVRFVIDRGCSCEGGGVRATQVLLELGEAPAPTILEALDRASDPAVSQQLSRMLLALGDAAVPCLAQVIQRRTSARLQLAVRLAGQLQNPKLVPALANLFDDSGPALRREAGLALANVGNGEAREVLFRGLDSGRADLALASAGALSDAGHPDVPPRLAKTLGHAIARGDARLAATLMRALGREDEPPEVFTRLLERAFDPETGATVGVPIRLAAIEALEHRGDERAERWLLAATRDPEARVSKRAHAILNARDREQGV